MKNKLKVSDLIKKVIASDDKAELENLKNQLQNKFVDVFGKQVSLYEIYFKK